jgi:hypothetical protein
MAEMFQKLGRARAVLVSLGNEAGPISSLDAHAAARPVVSGNDMVYKYANPEGTGVRVATKHQCELAVRHLLSNPELCDELGKRGQRLIIDEYSEPTQRRELQQAIDYVLFKDRLAAISNFSASSRFYLKLEDLGMRIQRKWLTLSRSKI